MVYNEVFIDYDKFIIDEFEFESGDILNDVDVEYLAKGTPKYDNDGNMTNAIVYCHSFNENYSSLDNLYRIIGEGKIFDYDNYYFIFATSLGFPNSC